MSDRYGFDSSADWQIYARRNDRWTLIEAFKSAVDVIKFVGAAPAPQDLIVRHIPSDKDGDGESFLREVNRRMGHHT